MAGCLSRVAEVGEAVDGKVKWKVGYKLSCTAALFHAACRISPAQYLLDFLQKNNSIVYLNCTFKSISYRVSSRRNSSINDLTRNSQISPKNNKLSLDSSVVFGKRERDPIKDILILNSHFFTLDFLLQPDIHIHHVAVFVI